MPGGTVQEADREVRSRHGEGGDDVVLGLDDALLGRGLADLRWLLHDALLGGARRLVVDLTAVHHLPSSAVASLLCAHRACRARGGAVVLRGAHRRTEEMLRRTGLIRVLHVESSRTGRRPARPVS